jgi:hypothetical protein
VQFILKWRLIYHYMCHKVDNKRLTPYEWAIVNGSVVVSMAFSKYVSDVVVFHLRMARRGRNMLWTERIKVTPINSQLRSQVYLRDIRIHNATGCTPQGYISVMCDEFCRPSPWVSVEQLDHRANSFARYLRSREVLSSFSPLAEGGFLLRPTGRMITLREDFKYEMLNNITKWLHKCVCYHTLWYVAMFTGTICILLGFSFSLVS